MKALSLDKMMTIDAASVYPMVSWGAHPSQVLPIGASIAFLKTLA
ncbi:hypothetical protein B398_00285 [Xylella fastidiosa 32]|nr:hypothetical protein B398_00285 [Xylella fastidiosa 32]